MDQILMHYLQVSQHMSQQFRNHFGKLNLTFPQALALNILGSEGPMPISRLAERTRSELDHRVIYVEATEKYRQLRSQVETGVNEYFSGLLGTLDPEERSCVSRGLELLDRALSNREE